MRLCRLIWLWLAMTFLATAVWGGDEKLAAELHRRSGTVDVIVQYRTAPTEAHHRRVAGLGGRLNAKMDFIRGAHYSVPASALAALADDPEVAYVTPDRAISPTFDPAPDNITNGTISASYETSKGWIGTGVGVAIIDSGIVDLPDFHTGSTSRIVYQQSFVGGSPTDQYGHGTHVAGILAGKGNGTVYQGVAYDANIINLRALDANGNGTDSSVIQAINTAIALKSKYNIRVINLSLGRPVFEPAALDPLCQAVEAAWRAGIFVAVAAGNQGRNNGANTSGYGTITSPDNDPYVMTVGSIKAEGTTVRTDDRIASYSSKGPTLFDHYVKPDVVAPGNMVASTPPAGLTLSNLYPSSRVGNTEYFILSGTSMATPVVAAWAAMGFQCC